MNPVKKFASFMISDILDSSSSNNFIYSFNSPTSQFGKNLIAINSSAEQAICSEAKFFDRNNQNSSTPMLNYSSLTSK